MAKQLGCPCLHLESGQKYCEETGSPDNFFKLIFNWRIIPQRIFNNGYAFQISIIHIKNLYDKKRKKSVPSQCYPVAPGTENTNSPWIHAPTVQASGSFIKRNKQAVVRMLRQSWKGHDICNLTSNDLRKTSECGKNKW